MRELLAAERPDDGLLAEEGSHADAASGRRWVVDPLDGTVELPVRLPAWGVSVALEDDAGTAVGVVLDPLRDDTFVAERGAALAAQRRARSRSGTARALDRALVATGFSYEPVRRAAQAGVVRRLLPQVRDLRRAGAAALDLAWLAAGRVDGYYERGLQPLGLGRGPAVVEEAGGAWWRWRASPRGWWRRPPRSCCETWRR